MSRRVPVGLLVMVVGFTLLAYAFSTPGVQVLHSFCGGVAVTWSVLHIADKP